MGSFKLNLVIERKNWERIAEQRARLQDFSVPFANIIKEWAQGNARKFARGVGAESTGADQELATWEPVTEDYWYQKHGPIIRGERALYPDWLMVRTGALMAALGNETSGFEKFISERIAAFGTPTSDEEAMKAAGNRAKRPTIFLDRTDRGMIRREMQRYLSLGAGYKAALKAISAGKAALQKENKELLISFAQTVR